MLTILGLYRVLIPFSKGDICCCGGWGLGWVVVVRVGVWFFGLVVEGVGAAVCCYLCVWLVAWSHGFSLGGVWCFGVGLVVVSGVFLFLLGVFWVGVFAWSGMGLVVFGA